MNMAATTISLQGGRLTMKQIAIIRWLSEGKTARDISELEGIKYHTVNNYIRDAFIATGTIKSASLVAMALRKGWIS